MSDSNHEHQRFLDSLDHYDANGNVEFYLKVPKFTSGTREERNSWYDMAARLREEDWWARVGLRRVLRSSNIV